MPGLLRVVARSAGRDVVAQLKALAEPTDRGILTEEEFAGQKAKILAG